MSHVERFGGGQASVAALTVAVKLDAQHYPAQSRTERAQLDRDIDRLRPASRRHGAGANHQRQLSQSACADNRAVRSGRSRGYLRSSDRTKAIRAAWAAIFY